MNHAYRLVWNARLASYVAVSEISRGCRRSSRTVKRATLAAGLLVTLNAMALDPGAIPVGGQVAAGQASIQTSGAAVTIGQTSAKTAIDWQSFNIGSQATVTFNQPGAASIALNRVIGQDASQIMGKLNSNGQVFLLNPNGVLFGSTAQVNVRGLVASTLGLSNDDFMAGNYKLAGSSNASVINQGSLTAAEGGYVALLARQAANEGVIRARLGNVSLAAGSDVTLNLNNGSLLGLTVNQGAVGALAQNSQLIQAEGGHVLMTAKAADQLVSAVVNNSGVIEARGVQAQDGVIRLLGGSDASIISNTGSLSAGRVEASARSVLQAGQITASSVDLSAGYALVQTQDARIRAEGGDVRLHGGEYTYLSGTVDASGDASKAAGGNITVTGESITLSAATLDVSGATATDVAGSLRVGGGAHGLDTDIRNAATVTVSGATSLKANGKQGRIVVWSDETTNYFGKTQAGERGFIEVSSKGTLNLGGSTQVGAGGQILYDPANIVIDAAAPSSFYLDLADPTPTAGTNHGTSATQLTGGNIVVASVGDNFGASNAGAVYLYNSTTGALISALYGSTAGDLVGSQGITALTNGNYVVSSAVWDNGAVANVGAVTWANGSTGLNGVVSAANSLIGGTANDQVGIRGATALSNGNYVVGSINWKNGAVLNAGAATWADGSTGLVGTVSTANSLVGSATDDQVGGGITALTNGNYVVRSSNWSNGAVANVGAATWANGATGLVGAVSAANSLVGSTDSDRVGSFGITALANGNYVVNSGNWDNGAITNVGAVTWANGATGLAGTVSAANSLVGGTAGDAVGGSGVTALTNGNYVVRSGNWDNGAVANVGAATWVNGTTGLTGAVSAANSLVGSTADDQVGSFGVNALSNGNYVVRSSNWDNGAVVNAGAVTWANGATGLVGTVSTTNSLVGTTAGDLVGNGGVTALSNGNYVVNSPNWNNGAVSRVGAATWANGATGLVGTVSAANSLIGSTVNDQVGSQGTAALTNGNYVVSSNGWDNGAIANAGAATWANGVTGLTGTVSAANSLVGSTANDQVGGQGTTVLTNGNYVVRSAAWSNGAIANVGAVTWGNGSTGSTGAVSTSNSLVGSTVNENLGAQTITALSNGNYVLLRPNFNSSAGAVWLVADPANAAAAINGSTSSSASVNPSVLAQATGAGSTVTLQASNNITVNSAVSVAGKLNLLAGNAMTLNAGGTITSTATGDAIVLSGNTFVNNAGSNALTASNGRWLVYSNAPAGNTFGGLASGNGAVWNATHAGNAPATIASGNRYVFAQQPTVNVAATAQTKTYDGSVSAAPAYTATGLVNASAHGNVFTQDAMTGALATSASANVGNYAITQGTLAGPAGYLFGTYTGANASITARAVTVTGMTATPKVYDGNDVAALTGGALNGMVAGETLSFSGQSGQFDTKNVGIGKAVTVSGLTLGNGSGLASNYSVTQPAGLTGDITAKAVTVTGIAAASKVYDGNDVATLTGGAVNGTVAGETLTLNGQTGQFNNKNVGVGKAVTVSGLTLGNGTGLASNYSVTQPIGVTGDVTAKALIASYTAQNKTFDGNTSASVTGSSANIVTGDALSFSQTAAFASAAVGIAKVVNVNNIAMSGADAGNYALQNISATATADIVALPVVVAPATASVVAVSSPASAAGTSSSAYAAAITHALAPISGEERVGVFDAGSSANDSADGPSDARRRLARATLQPLSTTGQSRSAALFEIDQGGIRLPAFLQVTE